MNTSTNPWFSAEVNFAPVMRTESPLEFVSLSSAGYPESVLNKEWLIGGYLENRQGMYSSEIYNNTRFIHLGIDIWAREGTPVYTVAAGVIFGVRDNDNPLDYGPTVIMHHRIEGKSLYILYGHLSRASIQCLEKGQYFPKGAHLADLGGIHENGGWVPHLHLQVSFTEPSDIDMPGVCAPEDVERLKEVYPDPVKVLQIR